MKKGILSIAALSGFYAMATQYNVIITKENNEYNTSVVINSTESLTEWQLDYESDCNYSFDKTEFYFDQDFSQTKTCNETYSRTKTITKEYSNGQTVSTETIEYNTVKDVSTTYAEKGTHLEANCKGIKSFNGNLPSGSYKIDHNNGINVECDMITDGGGWTKIYTANVIHEGIFSSLAISDLGLSYTHVLYSDNGSTSDFATPTTNNYYDWTGYHLAWNTIKLNNGIWYNTSTGSTVPGNIDNQLPLSYFNILEHPSKTCYAETNKVDNYCGKIVKIQMPSGKRIVGFSDTQSIASSVLDNNYFDLKFDLYVR